MPAIYRNGTRYGNAPTSYPASNVAYDPTTSGLSATNAQNAIDELRELDPQIKTASGSIATFTDGGDDIPVSEYECEIVAQQASGTPTPDNPLPITGFSQADIPVCGINIWNEETEEGYINSSGGYNSSSTSIRSKYFTPVKAGESYYLKRPDNYTSGYVCLYDENQNFLNRRSLDNSVYTIASDTHYIKISCYNYGSSGYQNDISINYPSTDTQYHAYTGNLYTVAFGQTIYGGKLVYKNGQWSIEATHGYVDLGTLYYVYNQYDGTGNGGGYSIGIANTIKKPLSLSDIVNALCSALNVESDGDFNNNTDDFKLSVNINGWVKVSYHSATSNTDLANKLSGVMLCYELATPVIIPITSSTRVKTISGVNNIFSNTGDNSVKYFTGGSDTIVDIVEQVASNIVSTIVPIQANAGYHNSVYRGKYLGSEVTAIQWAAISAGTFDDMFIGDYWTIGSVNWRIAHFNYYINCGDTNTTSPHVVIVPDTNLYSYVMNDTNVTTGGYFNSKMRGGITETETFTGDGTTTEFTVTKTPSITISVKINGTATSAYTLSGKVYTFTTAPAQDATIEIVYVNVDYLNQGGLAQAKTTIEAAFGSSHILSHRVLLTTATNSSGGSNWAWQTSSIDLMSEVMVYGTKVWANSGYEVGVEKEQLALFRLDHSRITNRATWWLRSAYSTALFAIVGYYGYADYGSASYSGGVRPAFAIF